MKKAYTLARAKGSHVAIGNIVCDLADVYCALGDLDRSCQNLREGLLIARDLNLALMKVHILTAALGLWQKMGRAEQAAAWLAPLLKDSSLSEEERIRLQNDSAHLELELGQEHFAAAVERGQTLDVDHVITDLLAELGATE